MSWFALAARQAQDRGFRSGRLPAAQKPQRLAFLGTAFLHFDLAIVAAVTDSDWDGRLQFSVFVPTETSLVEH